MSKPTKFFENWETAKVSQKERSGNSYQMKILKRYFPSIIEKVNLGSIWFDDAVVNKLEEVKYKAGDVLLNCIDIKVYPKLTMLQMYNRITKQEIWKDIVALISVHGEAGIIFPIKYSGNCIFHNFARQPDDVLKEPKIIWPGNSGTDLTLQKLDVFLKEYNSGE